MTSGEGVFAPLQAFVDAVWFAAGLQIVDPIDPEFGGIAEGEGDSLGVVVQTDNTSQAVWAFSRYRSFTGDTTIDLWLERAWTYVNAHPAYDEEGPETTRQGYYRIYNCAWALISSLEYVQTTGDSANMAYSDSCANYLSTHTLDVVGNQGFYDRVNPPVLGLAAAALRAYGEATQDSLWLAKSVARGQRVREWIEADPAILGVEEWAVSGGAAMWGTLESWFREYPEDEAAWLATYAPLMDTFANPGVFENAWQCWYALAANRIADSTGDPQWATVHEGLVSYLLQFDTDADGGIPAKPADPDTLDQSWVTTNLVFSGLSRLLDHALDVPEPGVDPRIVRWVSARPNPFAAASTISFRVDSPHDVQVDVFDVTGRRVARVFEARSVSGLRDVPWPGTDDAGRPLPSGVYFVRVSAGGERHGLRVVRLR
ncbi:MAG: T9SS type A sorting domain-containing protein [Gemmatimonadetes bacterium]|nr:T9SS type A sorting domain-containing protein [Gemmatimonadota bacterium]